MNHTYALMNVLAALCTSALALASEIYVPADYATIQSAIDASADGDVVIVSPGRYVENIDYKGKAITVRSVDPQDRQTVESTIIDGGGVATCVKFVSRETGASSISGFTITNGNATGSWDKWTETVGGGIRCMNSSPVISFNIIRHNSADGSGGGIYATTEFREAPLIISNTIDSNTGGGIVAGAGTLSSSHRIAVLDNTIVQNTAQGGGGLYGSGLLVEGNSFTLNYAFVSDGGGVMLYDLSSLSSVVVRNVFYGNATEKSGGALALGGTSGMIVITENTISGNTSERSGSAIFSIGGGIASHNIITDNAGWDAVSNLTALNNTVVGNQGVGIVSYWIEGNLIQRCATGAKVADRGIAFDNVIVGNSIGLSCQSRATVAGNTIVGNGAGVVFQDKSSLLSGCAITQSTGPAVVAESLSEVAIDSCLIEGGISSVVILGGSKVSFGPGNIDADPLLVDPGHWDGDTFIPGDYHLLPGSPCIDAGTNDVDNPDTNAIETLPATDIAGLRRVIDGDLDGTATVDIGAYEYLPGDVNYDGKVNILDLIVIRASLGQDPSSSLAARKADVNADGRVNIEDLIMVRGRLGK